MTLFRYLSTDLVTGDIIGELPLHDVTFTRLLNGAGPMSASLRLPGDDLYLAEMYVDACAECRRCIYIFYGDALVWAGPVWMTDYDTTTQTLGLDGAELWSYWRRRRIRADAEFTNTDQFAIARSLINTAKAATGGDISMTVAYGSSGVLRDRTYKAAELKKLGEAIEQLSEVEDGFDFTVEVTRLYSGAFRRRLHFYYPTRTRTLAESQLYLTLGNNMQKLTLPRNGAQVSNAVDVIGAGEGIDMLRHRAIDTDMLAAGFPLLEEAVSYKDITRLSTLIDHANGELAARKYPISLPRATVLLDDDPQLGTYELGDQGRIMVLPGTEPRWPGGLELDVRLNGYTVRPPDDGEAPTVELIFEEQNV